jgi:hypothetical protein
LRETAGLRSGMSVARLPGVTPRDDRAFIRDYLAHEAAGHRIEPRFKNRFGEYLVQQGAITRAQLLRALVDREISGGRIGDAVVRLGYCTRWLVEAFAKKRASG